MEMLSQFSINDGLELRKKQSPNAAWRVIACQTRNFVKPKFTIRNEHNW